MTFVAFGLMAGVLSGLMGIGGATILIPLMTFFGGMTQHQAQGTTLAAMVPPIGILAAWVYYKSGHVNIPIAGLIVVGFILGAVVGAKTAVFLPTHILKKLFAVLLIGIGIKMWF